MPLIAWILSGFTALGGQIISSITARMTLEVAKWVAYKAFWIFIIFVAFPILMFNFAIDFFVSIAGWAMNYVSSTGGFDPVTIQITGMAGWIAEKLQLAAIVTTFLTAVSMRFALGVLKIF